MAQFVRRPEVLGAMEHKLQRDKNRTSYFGNVKTRLGSKLPAGVKQPPEFTKAPYKTTQTQVQAVNNAADTYAIHHHPIAGCSLNRVPHIRNPKLRQYYLQGISSEQNNVTVKPEYENGQQNDKPSREEPPMDTVFSISSHLKNGSTLADKTRINPDPSSSSHVSTLSSTLIPRQQLRVPKENKSFASQSSSLSELNPDPDPELTIQPQLAVADPGCSHSPSPDAEYDKLLDVEAVPMPDGHTCLLALPPECTEGEGPTLLPYLKLFCRYITDRKGVVSGVLLVTSNKIFFDPCKTHPLVMEHGCEEYLLSCSIDCLASVTFFSDITHVHFNPSQLRWKGPRSIPKSKNECLQGSSSNHEAEAVPALESAAMSKVQSPAVSLSREGSEEGTESRDMAETERQLDSSPPEDDEGAQSAGTLGVAVLSSAASFCCGGQDVGSKVKMELLHTDKTEKGSIVKDHTAVPQRLPSCCPGDLMFIRMRVHQAAAKKKTIAGLRLGTTKTLPRRDSWLALSKESSDELYAYLAHWRPDVCILEGGGAGGDGDDEEFVVIEDREEVADKEDEVFQSHWCTGDEWEMVSVEESLAKPTVVIDREPDGLSEIVAQSRILEAPLIKELCAELPPRTIGHTWHLTYSTSSHGSSLKNLYRKLSNTDSPALIVIRDALGQVFGSFLSHPLRISETFYGTGETFLFMLHPRFKCFRWTGENSFFIKGDVDSFAIGGGSGHFGLWLDETLYLGRSSPCYTFNNCCLSETDDFRVMEMEVWTFS